MMAKLALTRATETRDRAERRLTMLDTKLQEAAKKLAAIDLRLSANDVSDADLSGLLDAKAATTHLEATVREQIARATEGYKAADAAVAAAKDAEAQELQRQLVAQADAAMVQFEALFETALVRQIVPAAVSVISLQQRAYDARPNNEPPNDALWLVRRALRRASNGALDDRLVEAAAAMGR
jgi:hypothetical protein